MSLTRNEIPALVSLAGNPMYVGYTTDETAQDFIGINYSVYAYLNAVWKLLGIEMRYEPDAAGAVMVDIRKLLQWEPTKEFTWPEEITDLIIKRDDLIRIYKILVYEKYGNPIAAVANDVVLDLRVLPGKISELQFGLLNDESTTWSPKQLTEKKFLTNSPRIKKTDAWALERLYFLYAAQYITIIPTITKQTYTSYNDTSLNSIMTPRLCRNPINGKLVNIFRVGSSHTAGSVGKIYMRVSTDNGVTWTGVNGIANLSLIIVEADVDVRNPGAFYTPTGRLIVMYMRYQGTTWLTSKIIYSDDDGKTFDGFTDLANPGTETNTAVATYCNRCVLDASGNLLYPYYYWESPGTGYKIIIAKSTDNGATWNTNYKTALNTFGTISKPAEPVIEDLGEGKFVIICRSISFNTAGYEVPIILYSSDYGEHWAGASETLSMTDLDNSAHNSGFLYLQGPGVNMGLGTAATNCLPDIIKISINGEYWMAIPYWIRNSGVETFVQKMSLIKVSSFIMYGVAAVRSPLTITLFEGIKAVNNGGNGSGVVIGDQIVYTTSEQTVAFTGGVMNLYTFSIDASILEDLASNYNFLSSVPNDDEINLNVKIHYTDGSSASIIKETFSELTIYSVYEFITSFSTLELYFHDPSKTVEKYEVWLTGNTSEAISETFTYVLDHIRKSDTKYFIFSNAHKMYDGARFTGISKATSKYTYQQSKRTLMKGYGVSSPSLIKSNTSETEMKETSSEWLTLDEMNWMRELLLSEEVYELVNGHIIPVFIETSDVVINEDDKNLRSVKIKYSYAHSDRVPGLLP